MKTLEKEFAEKVVAWFCQEGRVLPWREGRNPYRIWVSEVMLQQTRIEAVIPYYHRFLAELPRISSLANCSEDKLLKLWEGLGYYSRVRNLKKAAQLVEAEFGGELPNKASALRGLPGIGEYTAGAIASIAYGEPEPAVDGNVLRVVCRVLGDRGDVLSPTTKKRITAQLRDIYPTGKAAGDLTEGIMEIGERVCIPNGVPLCTVCPLKELCVAKKENLTAEIPVRSSKKERKKIPMTVFVLRCGDKYALRKRDGKGLLAGMWEFYHTENTLSKEKAKSFLEEQGFQIKDLHSCGTNRHIFTHLEWQMKGYAVTVTEEKEGFLWLSREEMERDFALPTAFQPFKPKK